MTQRGFVFAAGLTVGALLAAPLLAMRGPRVLALSLVVACLPYLWLAVARLPGALAGPGRASQGPSQRGRFAAWPAELTWPLLAAALPGLVMVGVQVTPLSDDLYRFSWDARVWFATGDAYAHAPASPALAHLRDGELFARINHPTIPTIYPPLAQALFVLGEALVGGPTGMKALGLMAHLMTVALLPGAVRRLRSARGLDPQGDAAPARAAWLLALNPLALSEGALAGHFDTLLGLCVLLAGVAFTRGRPWRAAGWLVGSIGLKLVGFFGLPLLLRRPRIMGLALLVGLLLAWPLTRAGHADGGVSGVAHFGQRWQGNAGPFTVLTWALDPVVAWLASETGAESGRLGPDEVAFASLRPWLQTLEQAGLRTKSALQGHLKPQRDVAVFPRHHAVGLMARALVVLCVLAVASIVGISRYRRPGHRWRGPSAEGLRVVLFVLLLLSPQVHPWYLLWLLPLELACERRAVLVWSLVILGAYAPLAAWRDARVWHESTVFVTLEFVIVMCAWLFESRALRAGALTRLGRRFNLGSA